MQLVLPSIRYKESFIAAVEEYQKEISNITVDFLSLKISELKNDFQAYVDQLICESFGKNLPPGYVPHTTYWLIDKNKYIGRVDIRHWLTQQLLLEAGHIGYNIRPSKRRQGYGKKILELALPKAKELGITKVLITCDETNLASKKVIEANGGNFENSVFLSSNRPRKLRYWIVL